MVVVSVVPESDGAVDQLGEGCVEDGVLDAVAVAIEVNRMSHTYTSFMIAAGINSKALSTYMGNSSIAITVDRYGHSLPGDEYHGADLLSTWLAARSSSGHGATRFRPSHCRLEKFQNSPNYPRSMA